MTRRRRGSWPETDKELADRDLVVTLAKRAGRHRLVFTVADLRTELSENFDLMRTHFGEEASDTTQPAKDPDPPTEEPGNTSEKYVGPKLHHSGDLWRHLAALEGDLIEEVGRRDFGQSPGSGSYRGRKKYVLRSRACEITAESAFPGAELDDPERAQLATWVAFRAGGSEPVPTADVTRVMQSIESLSLSKPIQTHALLQGLAVRGTPVVRKVAVAGERWVRWQPLGDEPDHEELQTWIKAYRRAGARPGSSVGKATVIEVGRELVRLTIRSSKSSTYRHGCSVRPHDVRAFAGSNEEGRLLAASIRRRSAGISAVIGDAAREVIGGTARVNTRIARVVAPFSGTVFYDVPDEPGFEQRVRIVTLQDLRSVLHEGVLESIEEDVHIARKLLADDATRSVELNTVIAARLLLAQREFGTLDDVLRDLEKDVGAFSETTQNEIREHRARFTEFLGRGIWSGDEEEVFENLTQKLGLNGADVLSAARPLVTPDEYAGWFSPDDRGGYTAAEFMWLAVPLRRFMNPRYTHRRDTDRDRAYKFMTDRVDALPYAANRLMAQSSTSLAAGARLLGRNFRSAVIIRRLGSSPDIELRRDALAALVLLDENPRELAEPILSNPSAPPDLLAETIMLLHVAGSCEPSTLPPWIRESRNWTVAAALREVMLARGLGRRIA
jgi:hypothetical protein